LEVVEASPDIKKEPNTTTALSSCPAAQELRRDSIPNPNIFQITHIAFEDAEHGIALLSTHDG
jgi:hypothetical protein